MSTILSLKFTGASSISMQLDVIYIYIILLGGSRTGSETSSAVRVCWCWCIPRTYHASAANHLDAAAGGSYLYGERRSSMMRLTPASVSTWHAASPTQRAVATLSHDDPITHTHTRRDRSRGIRDDVTSGEPDVVPLERTWGLINKTS